MTWCAVTSGELVAIMARGTEDDPSEGSSSAIEGSLAVRTARLEDTFSSVPNRAMMTKSSA